MLLKEFSITILSQEGWFPVRTPTRVTILQAEVYNAFPDEVI